VGEVHAQFGADEHQRREDVGGVADEGHMQVFQALASRHVFEHGGHIADDLGRMVVIGQAVEHRHVSVFGEFGHGLVLQSTAEDGVAHAREDFGGIVHGLAHAEVNLTRLEIEGVAAQFGHGHLERDARAGGGFFENHGQRSALQQFRRAALLIGGFDAAGEFDHVEQFLFGEILGVNEVTKSHGRCPFC
jgi:hypothetical protein